MTCVCKLICRRRCCKKNIFVVPKDNDADNLTKILHGYLHPPEHSSELIETDHLGVTIMMIDCAFGQDPHVSKE